MRPTIRLGLLIGLVLCGLFLFVQRAHAQADDGGVTLETTLQTVTELQHQVATLKKAKTDGADAMQLHLEIAAIIGTVCKFLLDLIKKLMKLDTPLKKYLPWVSAVLGAIVVVVAKFGAGLPLINAIVIGGGPLGAVVINELLAIMKKSVPHDKLQMDVPPVTPEPAK